jgi:hypothetical protein
MAKGKTHRPGVLQTLLIAAGETKSITIEIPGELTKSGQPLKQTINYHNNAGVSLAYDILEIRIVSNAEGKPEVHVETEVRVPTQRENGEMHEAATRTHQPALM